MNKLAALYLNTDKKGENFRCLLLLLLFFGFALLLPALNREDDFGVIPATFWAALGFAYYVWTEVKCVREERKWRRILETPEDAGGAE